MSPDILIDIQRRKALFVAAQRGDIKLSDLQHLFQEGEGACIMAETMFRTIKAEENNAKVR
jgi:hypothetical protein